jgi:hypothetical protein
VNERFPNGWILAILTLIAYFSIGILLSGEAALLVGVLLLVLITWWIIYEAHYRKSLGNRELVVRMYDDFRGTVERIAEKVAQVEVKRRAAEHERQTRRERRDRRVSSTRTKEDPAVEKYAEMIENRVRDAKVRQDQSEGTREPGP